DASAAVGDDPEALAALERLYAQVGRSSELADVLRRRAAQATDMHARVELLRKRAQLLLGPLGRSEEGLACVRELVPLLDEGEPLEPELVDALARAKRATPARREDVVAAERWEQRLDGAPARRLRALLGLAALVGRAATAGRAGAAAAAARRLDEALAVDPRSQAAALARAELHLAHGQPSAAAALMAIAKPDAPDPWRRLARAQRAAGDLA